MWSRAVYDFGLTTEQFWQLTPKHFYLLHQRHLDELLHREMTAAFTTAAVLNSAFYRAEQAVSPLDYMPNHPDRARTTPVKAKTPEQTAAMENYMAKVMQLTAELKERTETGKTGPILSQMSESVQQCSE